MELEEKVYRVEYKLRHGSTKNASKAWKRGGKRRGKK